MKRTALVQFIFFIALGATVTSAGIYDFIVSPLLSGEHYDYFEGIYLEKNSTTQAVMVSLNSGDTLFYKFEATNVVVSWSEDPAGNKIHKPTIYAMSDNYYHEKFVAESTGVYKLVFSSAVPDREQTAVVFVEVRTGVVPGKSGATN